MNFCLSNRMRTKQKPYIEYSECKSELEVHLAEYKALREEIVSLGDFSRRNITTTYAGIGILFAASPFIIQYGLQIIFLIFPVFFYCLGLASVKYALAQVGTGKYICKVLTPEIRACLKRQSNNRNYDNVLRWEESRGIIRNSSILFIPALTAHFWITIFTSLACLALYYVFPLGDLTKSYPWCKIMEWILICINIVAFLYTSLMGILAGFKDKDYAR